MLLVQEVMSRHTGHMHILLWKLLLLVQLLLLLQLPMLPMLLQLALLQLIDNSVNHSDCSGECCCCWARC